MRISRGWGPNVPGGGRISSVLTVNTTQAGTIADTNETDLWTYSLPANTLNADGRGLRITVTVTFAANANTKTARLYFGGSSLTINPGVAAPNGVVAAAIYTVLRTGATAQLMTRAVANVGSSTQGVSQIAPAETMANAITIRVTGLNGTASANDVVFTSATVETVN